jgi:2-polyprenyl-3-methyl-5-hydroxy-6-metoxy-1,4-benzoquinol methylase
MLKNKFYTKLFHHFSIFVFYYYFLLFILLCILAFFCSFYFLLFDQRFPLNEIEDSSLFNTWFNDIANGMLYDMSYIQKYFTTNLPEESKKFIHKDSIFLDIGSGGGDASIHHLQNFFGKDVQIILSDLHPKIDLWKENTTKNISYIKDPVDATNLTNLNYKYDVVSCFGSLHHMDETTIKQIFLQIRKNNKTMFIVEPRRFPTLLQFLHILTLPVVGFISYNLISLFGSTIVSENVAYSIPRFLLVPFFMTWDHILGASRRYKLEEIELFGSENGLKTIHYNDALFDYYILT